MKNKSLLITGVIMAASSLFFTSCKKEDTTAPVLTLTGTDMTLDLLDTYNEPGFTATDDEDGDLTSAVTVTGAVVNSDVAVTTLTYSVSDAAGNTASATRTVTVRTNKLAGTYDVASAVTGKYVGNYNFTATVTQSSTAYNKILVSNFGGLGTAVVVNATVSGKNITVANQSPTGMQDPGAVSGSGTIQGIDIKNFTYSIVYTSSGSDNCVDTYSNHQ